MIDDQWMNKISDVTSVYDLQNIDFRDSI